MKKQLKRLLMALYLLPPAAGQKVSGSRKIEILRSYLQQQPRAKIFIETGTEFGTTIEGVRSLVDEVHSIELNLELYERAKKLFASDSHVHIYCGDSGRILPEVLRQVNAPALVWLDAHPPGPLTLNNTPLLAELTAALSHHNRPRIVIDDMRHFSRMSILRVYWLARMHGYRSELTEGLLRLTPRP